MLCPQLLGCLRAQCRRKRPVAVVTVDVGWPRGISCLYPHLPRASVYRFSANLGLLAFGCLHKYFTQTHCYSLPIHKPKNPYLYFEWFEVIPNSLLLKAVVSLRKAVPPSGLCLSGCSRGGTPGWPCTRAVLTIAESSAPGLTPWRLQVTLC